MIQILLIEDNLGDIRLAEEALSESKLRLQLSVVRDGQAALNYLNQTGDFEDVPRPDLILLDLNLPKYSGKEVLAYIKSRAELKHIPVVVLTSSQAEEDIVESYRLYANCYISKPLDFDQFIKVVKSIESFWFSIVKLPRG
ncbi:MAG: response regulator [Trueperaceae bacterium]|nr:response regulator [Trueperaceae bacterium]